MDKSIDRTSYRRSTRNLNQEEMAKKKENKLNLLSMFCNQMIISLLIIISIIAAKYFEIDFVEDWISTYMSDDYEILNTLNTLNTKIIPNSMETYELCNDLNGDTLCDNESGEYNDTTENTFMTAVEGVNQLADDAKFVSKNYDFIVPLHGTITSEFGCRTSTSKIVSPYHTGLDIAANSGTDILASHGGKVILAENFSSYGNCIMIEDGELVTVYAHCLSLNVKEGDNVEMGRAIAKVGMTGNATGPHLHFEIRYQERFVNPKDILGEI